jgi:hypothetical protein
MGRICFFIAPESETITAVKVDEAGSELKLGTPQALFRAHGVGYRLGMYDVSPDGQRFLIDGETDSISDTALTLVLNWDAELKR